MVLGLLNCPVHTFVMWCRIAWQIEPSKMASGLFWGVALSLAHVRAIIYDYSWLFFVFIIIMSCIGYTVVFHHFSFFEKYFRCVSRHFFVGFVSMSQHLRIIFNNVHGHNYIPSMCMFAFRCNEFFFVISSSHLHQLMGICKRVFSGAYNEKISGWKYANFKHGIGSNNGRVHTFVHHLCVWILSN